MSSFLRQPSCELLKPAALYGSIILFGVNALGAIESWALNRLVRYVVLLIVVAGFAAVALLRRAEFANAPHMSLQFDDVPPDSFFALDLAGDRDLTNNDEDVESQTAGARRKQSL